LNSQQIVLHIGPSASFADADAIENVVLKRGADIVRPINRQVTPVDIRNAFSATRTVSEGDFTFPFSAFDPPTGVTIVMIGRTGNFEWALATAELARMK